MSIFSGYEEIVEQNHPLAPHTWYRLGGPADYFLRPRNAKELKEIIRRCGENHIRMHVLGFGSNLLVSDEGVRGAVIQLQNGEFAQTQFQGETVTAWAGAELSKLVLDCVEKGLSGVEALTGIPGSVGGAVRMNAGGRFGDIGSAVEAVTLMDIQGTVFEKKKPELIFDYRTVNIRARFILNAQLKLAPGDPEKIMRTVKEGWIYKKNSQPLNTRNCGCVFKNPPGTSAGALIDRAGLKGHQIGGAVVSEKHANFIVAKDGCTSRDVTRLIDVIRQRVREQFDVELELELEIWQ
ncbi:MAG TPA: UDP-N-acetylmuramate dehydrogenase [Sedimentisphaerales bacterium]|jgi:UDP-N-acetylmuramate dehydrogenase|nr:UDP-N-acetylmuramate dehydrogenase [Sedimentisphaerales bacterium]HNU31325.1 UDP-N-acetylmuramate dehydrogenase [Sedimentisphaerales bacterium]